MRAAGNIVAEERLARVDLVDAVQPIDGVVGLAVVRFQPGLPT